MNRKPPENLEWPWDLQSLEFRAELGSYVYTYIHTYNVYIYTYYMCLYAYGLVYI